jgi:glycosyltransferase involved in cell wall biosynthesis
MIISVIIPAFNEENTIGRTLQALADQTISHDSFEVIVVDNGSIDSTARVAKSYASALSIRVVSKLGGSIAGVRNHGAELAMGRTLAFLDADCLAPPTWLADSLAQEPANSIWGAHYLVPPEGTWVGKVWGAFQAKEQQGPVSFIPSSNLFIARVDFDRIGGFRESLKTSEDVDLSLRAKKHGMQVLAFPRLAVIHAGTPRTLRHFYQQNRWHGMHVLRVFLANLPQRSGLLVIAMSFYILVMFWATLIVPLIVLPFHHPQMILLPLLLLIAPAVVLSLWKTAMGRRLSAAPALFVLYMTYFLARAASLTQKPPRSHR